MTTSAPANTPDQTGKTIVVTGGNTGLGFQTVLALARHGATTILSARNRNKGEAAVKRIRDFYPAADVYLELLDLADLSTARAFADRVGGTHGRIDVLINNAGLASPPRRMTTLDGFELQFGVNFLGHFALTGLLLPKLLRADAPRVITLSSIMHRYGRIELDYLMSERRYSAIGAYNQSKLATLIFAEELQRRSSRNGWDLLSLAAHPGIARTELTKARPGQPVPWFNQFSDFLAPLFTGTAATGALSSIFAATSPNVVPGGYYGPSGWGEIKGLPGPAKRAPTTRDPEIASALWERAEEFTGVQF